MLIALDGPSGGLDPVRLQKGMFLLSRQGALPKRERYWFVPYGYGPMSPDLYRDLDRLVEAGLVERRAVRGYSWSRFAATPAGSARARALSAGAHGRCRASLRVLERVKASIARKGFAELLDDIYRRYPEYAAQSVFRRR